jgi:hypothetical protein
VHDSSSSCFHCRALLDLNHDLIVHCQAVMEPDDQSTAAVRLAVFSNCAHSNYSTMVMVLSNAYS